ncbi:hypothetical protein HDV05_002422, partial [Chytridiales sp. JEL 0842]
NSTPQQPAPAQPLQGFSQQQQLNQTPTPQQFAEAHAQLQQAQANQAAQLLQQQGQQQFNIFQQQQAQAQAQAQAMVAQAHAEAQARAAESQARALAAVHAQQAQQQPVAPTSQSLSLELGMIDGGGFDDWLNAGTTGVEEIPEEKFEDFFDLSPPPSPSKPAATLDDVFSGKDASSGDSANGGSTTGKRQREDDAVDDDFLASLGETGGDLSSSFDDAVLNLSGPGSNKKQRTMNDPASYLSTPGDELDIANNPQKDLSSVLRRVTLQDEMSELEKRYVLTDVVLEDVEPSTSSTEENVNQEDSSGSSDSKKRIKKVTATLQGIKLSFRISDLDTYETLPDASKDAFKIEPTTSTLPSDAPAPLESFEILEDGGMETIADAIRIHAQTLGVGLKGS